MNQDFTPKFFTAIQEGYTPRTIASDLIAGLTVAIAALPMSMAFAIASGTVPERGLYTAIIAGFLISFLGGSRFQIGGPTGAFIVVIYGIIEKFGYDGLVIATLMAGLILIAAGLLRLGVVIRYVPGPLITGFTAGIAVIIASSQVKDFLGLRIEKLPSDFLQKWEAIVKHINSADPQTVFVALSSLLLIILIKKFKPAWPGFLLAAIYGILMTYFLHLPVETISTRFGGIPSSLPELRLPQGVSPEHIYALVPSALTIAFLAGVESLLSAVVADGMTGRRHRSNAELVAQGTANIASVLMGGIPATGAIARTATNIKSGGKTPLSGMLHALFILLFVVFLAPLAGMVPLASLAAILMMVAWNMSEIHKFIHLFRAPRSDIAVLLCTFLLTVFVDLTIGVSVGLVLALVFLVKTMIETSEIKADFSHLEEEKKQPKATAQAGSDVQVFEIIGPLFFGAASRLDDALRVLAERPKVFILRFDQVTFMDATGAYSLGEFIDNANRHGTRVILCGARENIVKILKKMDVLRKLGPEDMADTLKSALARSTA